MAEIIAHKLQDEITGFISEQNRKPKHIIMHCDTFHDFIAQNAFIYKDIPKGKKAPGEFWGLPIYTTHDLELGKIVVG